MPKELLIYNQIDGYSAGEFITEFAEIESADDISVRINCNGGSPEYGWGMIAKFAEHKGAKAVKVDGKAYSMGLFFLCYADTVEALDVSEFLLHRAAYPMWYENDPEFMDAATKGNLERINKSLQTAFENKVNVKLFEEIKGVKVKEIFSMDSRQDVFLTAKEALKIGLISKINKITPEKKAEIAALMDSTAKVEVQKAAETEPEKSNKNKPMTIETFKAENPALYAEIIALGVTQERDRVESCLVFQDIDPKAVKEAIESGKPLTQKQMSEFSLKAMSKKALGDLEKESADPVKTTEVEGKEKTEKETALAAFEAKAKAALGLK